jgi:hypothetical protein
MESFRVYPLSCQPWCEQKTRTSREQEKAALLCNPPAGDSYFCTRGSCHTSEGITKAPALQHVAILPFSPDPEVDILCTRKDDACRREDGSSNHDPEPSPSVHVINDKSSQPTPQLDLLLKFKQFKIVSVARLKFL